MEIADKVRATVLLMGYTPIEPVRKPQSILYQSPGCPSVWVFDDQFEVVGYGAVKYSIHTEEQLMAMLVKGVTRGQR